MFKILKNFNWIILYSFLCIFLGILTFLTFINESFIPLNDKNLEILLIIDIILISIFFYVIFKNIYRFYNLGKKKRSGYQTSIKYVTAFSLLTLIPSLIVAIFSLFIFNFGIENYFDKQIKKAVNNSFNVAKNYLENSKENVKSDVVLMSVGLNRVSEFFYINPERFRSIVKSEKILRRIDDVYLIDSIGNIIFSDVISEDEKFIIPSEENYNQALEGNSVFITDSLQNKTTVMIKLNNLVDTYLYISRNIEENILRYLNETEQAVSFYYSIENSETGIKITFAVIYVIVVSLLLFICIVLAISFARRLTTPIINLIKASDDISKGELNTKVPNIDSDEEFKKLNQNFNNMIERLKKQQDKLLISERYGAWETVARKLAHEIKNPLTPIQLSIDRLREKYSSKILDGGDDFEKYLQTINRQIKDIENLVNEFSNFARMPRPLMKKINIFVVFKRSFDLFKMTSKNQINLKSKNTNLFLKGDEEQLNRVFMNLLKNSEESIQEKSKKMTDYKGKIDIEINTNNHYIIVSLTDNGTGVSDIKKAMNPYFTTKIKGTGLGLPIVSKIINEHSGDITISNNRDHGAKVNISLPKINE